MNRLFSFLYQSQYQRALLSSHFSETQSLPSPCNSPLAGRQEGLTRCNKTAKPFAVLSCWSVSWHVLMACAQCIAATLEVFASGRLLFVWMTETVLRGEARMFAPGDARWLGERRRVPQNKPFSPRAAGVLFRVISNLAPPDPFHLLLAINSGGAARCTRARTAGAKLHDIGHRWRM